MTLESTLTIQIARLRYNDDYHSRRTYRMAPEAPLPVQEYRDSPHVNDSPTRIRRAYHQMRLLHD